MYAITGYITGYGSKREVIGEHCVSPEKYTIEVMFQGANKSIPIPVPESFYDTINRWHYSYPLVVTLNLNSGELKIKPTQDQKDKE